MRSLHLSQDGADHLERQAGLEPACDGIRTAAPRPISWTGLGLWRILVEPVGLEPTLGFLPLIKSQVSASNSSTTPKLVGHREVESRPSG